MEEQVEISVIVPVYNVERYLRRCLDSLLAQTLKDIEIICVNDGSTDGSAGILEEYASANRKIRVVTRPNGGLSAARNSGLEVATARYLMFCDSDDYVEPTWCEALYGAIVETGADLAVCGVTCEGLSSRDLSAQQTYFRHPYEGPHAIDERVLLDTDVCVWDKIFRRELVVSAGLSFATGLRHEDEFFFWDYVLRSNRIAYVPARAYHYILRDDGVMGGERKDASVLLDYVRGFRGVAERLARMPSGPRFRCALLRRLLRLTEYAIERVSKADRLSLFEGLVTLVESLAVGVNARQELNSFEQGALCKLLRHDATIDFASVRRARGLLKRKETPFRETLYLAGIPIWRRRGRFADFMDDWQRRKGG